MSQQPDVNVTKIQIRTRDIVIHRFTYIFSMILFGSFFGFIGTYLNMSQLSIMGMIFLAYIMDFVMGISKDYAQSTPIWVIDGLLLHVTWRHIISQTNISLRKNKIHALFDTIHFSQMMTIQFQKMLKQKIQSR